MKNASLSLILLLGLIGFYPFVLLAHGPATLPMQLTFNTVSDNDPVISSDGLKVAFIEQVGSNFQVFVINTDGTGRLQLTSNNANHTSVSISSNGGKVAYQEDSGTDADVWVVNSDGSGQTSLERTNADELEPAISGDGVWVAFVSFASSYQNCPTCNNTGGDPEIFEIKTDGTNLRQVTINNKDDFVPSVSSNGAKIAFQSNIPATYEIFVINSDGTGLTQLSSGTGDSTSSSPSISADGSKVAYDSNGPATQSIYHSMGIVPEPLIPYQVYVANSNGVGPPVQLSTTGADNFTPSLSGDGRKVAYVSTGDGDREVYLVDSDGTGQPLRITNNTVFDVEPSVDLDGDSIVFSSNVDGDFEIFVSHTTPDVHDVAVTAITVPRRIGYNAIQANPLKVNVTITNQGTVSETVTVEISFLNGPVLSSQTTTVSPGTSKTLVFGIVTNGLATGSYTLVATAVPVAGEANTLNNTLQGGTIQVRKPGDVDGDGDVDLDDLVQVWQHQFTTGVSNVYDIDNDSDVDIDDLLITFLHQFS